MSSAINWAAAQARSADAKRLEAAPASHPFSLFVALTSRNKKRHR
jgi:hypothetical protein